MIEVMGHFTAIGMREPAPAGALVINTCSDNDTAECGDDARWSWCNPTNRALQHEFEGAVAVSVECLWQGTKAIDGRPCPDPLTLAGDWRRGKAKKPRGAWDGEGRPLVTLPGAARRRIYIPAYRRLIEHWLRDPEVADRVAAARAFPGLVLLRDHDVGRGLDQNGPMSHAWLLARFLNDGRWPG